MKIDLTNAVDVSSYQTIITAKFKLSIDDLVDLHKSKRIYIDGKHYKVPYDQVRNALVNNLYEEGLVTLTLTSVD